MGGFRKALADAVSKLATKTSVDQLKRQGVREVNVVGLDRIAQFVDEAVHRSLRDKLLLGEREAIADATRAEFLKLIRSNEELKQRNDRASEEVDGMRREIQQLRQELEGKLDRAQREVRPSWEHEDQGIEKTVRAVVAESLRNAVPGKGLEQRVLEVVMNLVGAERRSALEAKAAARDQEVEVLKRRISKLNESLTEAESRMGRMASAKEVDDGIASIYRDVQGLSHADDDRERKRELMAGIFAANLALQRKS